MKEVAGYSSRLWKSYIPIVIYGGYNTRSATRHEREREIVLKVTVTCRVPLGGYISVNQLSCKLRICARVLAKVHVLYVTVL